MDLTIIGHALAAAVIQVVVGMLTGDYLTGGLIGCTFFFAREHTQAEYRYIAEFCGGKRERMPWYGGFLPKAWNIASVFDFAAPAFLCFLIYIVTM
ncbi:hypothetical protein DU292_08230 [Escherichia coli]|uniref:hypothetical protein n=1 Tax=Escherichia coli TaxID=562 RepID=UPI0005A7060D|nr:hypothetical protein [Escherichia coli]EHL7589010.1 hypothetical protein [Escherichia coli]EHL7630105.1 hypothetical protein [Escherichia coli]EKX2755130.1 hypothetical protein [Escherichia coli]ELQ7669048.1 hypothetical protein [Escherichia coli]KZI67183.1 hypothetical protein AWG71_26235 [Escherichia coli]